MTTLSNSRTVLPATTGLAPTVLPANNGLVGGNVLPATNVVSGVTTSSVLPATTMVGGLGGSRVLSGGSTLLGGSRLIGGTTMLNGCLPAVNTIGTSFVGPATTVMPAPVIRNVGPAVTTEVCAPV